MVPCCCCLSNNVRHLALLALSAAVALLYANLVLFNFTAVLHKDLHPNLLPVASLDSLHEYSIWHDRKRRSYNLTSTATDDKTFYTEEEGYPILPSTKPLPTTPSPTSTTTRKPTTPRLVFFSNSPATKWTTRVVRSTVETTRTPATTSTTSTAKATTTTRNVVLEEVQRALDKLEKRDKDEEKNPEKYRDDSKKEMDDIGKTPEEFSKKPIDLPKQNYVFRSLLYAAPGLGCLIGTPLAMVLVRVVGVRLTVTFCLVFSAILQIVLPFVVSLGFPALFPIRLLLGVCFSIALPAAGALAASWGTLKEQLSFIATVFIFLVTAPILSWSFTMLLYSNEVDPLWIYVIHALPTLVFALIFIIFYRDQPQDHPWVNGIELNRIVAGKVRDLTTNRAAVAPCGVLLRSLSAWSIWVSAVGFFCALSLLITFLPSFLSCQQVFMVDHLGAYSILPYFAVPLFFVIGGLVNILSCSSTTFHVRVCNTLAFVASALFLIGVPIISSYGPDSGLALPLLLLCIAPLGLVVSGFLRSATLVGRGFAQHIISCFGICFGLAFSGIPFLVNYLINENILSEWNKTFMIVAGILAVSSIIFAFFGRGRSASWAENTWDPLVRTKMLTTDPIDVSADECGLYEMRLIPKSEKR